MFVYAIVGDTYTSIHPISDEKKLIKIPNTKDKIRLLPTWPSNSFLRS